MCSAGLPSMKGAFIGPRRTCQLEMTKFSWLDVWGRAQIVAYAKTGLARTTIATKVRKPGGGQPTPRAEGPLSRRLAITAPGEVRGCVSSLPGSHQDVSFIIQRPIFKQHGAESKGCNITQCLLEQAKHYIWKCRSQQMVNKHTRR